MSTANQNIKIIVRGKSESATKMQLTSGKFSMIIDEPPSMGGTNSGPSPIQVLLMSLAGCLNITGHEVAKQRGLNLNGMEIKIEGVMNPAAFMGLSNEERAGFQQIQVTVIADMDGAAQAEIDSWLEESENRCPVTDNIKSLTPIAINFMGKN